MSASFFPPGHQMHMESPPDYEDDQVSTIQGHGTYMETHRVPSDGYPITALAFDPIEELLWVGTGNGRLSALAQPGMQKHVSVRAHPLLSPVRQIRCFGEGVVSISGRQVQMHNKNCLALCAAPASAMLGVDERGQEGDIKSVNSRPKGGGHGRPALGKKEEDENVTGTVRPGQEEFTCGALNVPPGHHHHPMAAYVGEHVTVGGSGTHVWELDLATGLRVVRTLEVASPSTCMESNRAMVIGGADGRLRFLDGSLRSGQAVERDLEAFTGPVTSMCTWNDMVAATGTQGRSLNPYDRSGRAPTRLLPDPLIKLFDLRMLRQSLPLSFAPALVAPSLLTLLPHTAQARLVVGAATTGQFLLCDPFNVTAADTAFFQVPNHHTGGPSPMACVAASPSGEMLALGTPDGLVISYTNSPEAVVNRPPVPLEILPSTPPPPPISIAPNDPTPASHFLFRPTHLAFPPHPLLPPASSFATTPAVLSSLPVRVPPARVINPELYTKMSVQDFLGYVPNRYYQYPAHSLLYGSAGKEAYRVVDPRRKEDGAEAGRREDPGEDVGGKEGGAGREDTGEDARPPRYRRVQIDFSVRGLDGFEFGRYNRTPLVGLENVLPNTYTNAILQMMFFVPEMKAAVCRHQYLRVCWEDEKSIVCEMAFLFHMLETASAHVSFHAGKSSAPSRTSTTDAKKTLPPALAPALPPALPPCQSSNFLRVFRHVPEVVALDLLEASTATPVHQRAEGAHRFFLSQLHGMEAQEREKGVANEGGAGAEGGKEGSVEGGHEGGREESVVDALYGYTVHTTNTFLHPPGLPPVTLTTRSFILELVHPRSLARGAGGSPSSSPSSLPPPATSSPPPLSLGTEAVPSKRERLTSALTSRNAAVTATTGGPSPLPPPLPTFSQVLHASLRRESRSRGWCDASKSYEPLKQERKIASLPTVLACHAGVTVGTGAGVARRIWHQLNPLGGPWLPERVRIRAGGKGGRKKGAGGGQVVVWEQVVDPERGGEGGKEGGEEGGGEKVKEEFWVGTSDGKTVKWAEELQDVGTEEKEVVEKEYELVSLVSFVQGRGGEEKKGGGRVGASTVGKSDTNVTEGHLLLHVKVPMEGVEGGGGEDGRGSDPEWQWYIVNDFLVEPTILEDALGFLPAWKEPCILLYRDRTSTAAAHAAWLEQLRAAGARVAGGGKREVGEEKGENDSSADASGAGGLAVGTLPPSIPVSIFASPSRSTATPLPPTFTPLTPEALPGRGDLVGIDAEFVQLEMETASVLETGARVVFKEGRQALARLSLLDVRSDQVMVDDYVLPSEPVMDYLTRFSGIVPEDLDPSLSRHHLVTARTAYLKLRCLIDRGVILVGHGLKKDFRIINVYVPPAQVIDTVDLWCLEGQRKISLRFLAAYLLGESIQGETHDSIEDARTAVRLYQKWEEAKKEGKLAQVLNGVYEYGRTTGWKLQQQGFPKE